jgi:ketosteroid isomerase-like protein
VTPRGGETAETLRGELEAAYRRAGEAYKAKDAAALMQMVTPDFVQQMPDGQVLGYQVADAGLREWFATADKVTDYTTRIRSVSAEGDEAVALVEENVSTAFSDETGTTHQRVQANTAQVTWVRTADGWRIRRSEYLSAKMTVDGVPVTPMMTAPTA